MGSGKRLSRMVAVVSTGLAAPAMAGPYLMTSPLYTQDFESLSWGTSAGTYSNFGQASSNTVGWVATNESVNVVTSYRPRNASQLKMQATMVGSDEIPPQDLAIGRFSGTYSPWISLFLKNGTENTIEEAEISFTVELWMKPTVSVQDAIRAAYDVGDFWTTESAPYANTDFAGGTFYRDAFPTSAAAGSQYVHSSVLHDLDWEPGESLAIMWRFSQEGYNADHLVGIDDISVAVPEPAIVAPAVVVAMGTLARRQRRPVALA